MYDVALSTFHLRNKTYKPINISISTNAYNETSRWDKLQKQA